MLAFSFFASPMTSAIPEKRNVSLTDDKSSFHLNAEKINADNEVCVLLMIGFNINAAYVFGLILI